MDHRSRDPRSQTPHSAEQARRVTDRGLFRRTTRQLTQRVRNAPSSAVRITSFGNLRVHPGSWGAKRAPRLSVAA